MHVKQVSADQQRPRPLDMNVSVVEPRCHECSGEVDAPSVRADEAFDIGVRAYREYPVSSNRDGLGERLDVIDGVNRAVDEDQIHRYGSLTRKQHCE
jgi:hypothetical protein